MDRLTTSRRRKWYNGVMAVDGIGRPYKGHRIRMVTRVDPATHLLAAKKAEKSGKSVSEWMAEVLTAAVRKEPERD